MAERTTNSRPTSNAPKRAGATARDSKPPASGGRMTAAEAEKLRKQGEKQAKELQAAMEKGLSFDAAKKIAGDRVDPKMMKVMERAQKLSASDSGNMGDVLGLAADFGGEAGLSDKQQKFLKALSGGLEGELDAKEATKVPGLVVDKETGKISVLGLLNLDAKDPTSKLIAQGIIAANTLLLLPLNEKLFEKSYQGASWAANHFDLNKASKHRIGFAAALATTAATSFWPDINGVIQLEKQGRKDVMKLANQFAPILDGYDHSASSRVSKLYRIRPEDNDMIYNERRRAGMEHNSERFRHAIEALGRVPLYGISVMRGQEALPKLQQEAEKAALAEKLTAVDERKAHRQAVVERAEEIKESYKSFKMTDSEALAKAEEEIKAGGKLQTESGDKKKEGFLNRMGRDAVNGGVLLAAPIMGMVAQNLFNQRQKDMDIQKVSASDMVFHLRKQLNDDSKAERFSLPKDVTVEGSKTGNNQIRLEDYVEQIFRQHQRDCHGSDATIPARYNERIEGASKQIADALRAGRLDGLALINLVGERNVVRDGGKTVASEDIVESEISRLEQELRHMEYVDREKYFADSSFTPQELREAWNGMDGEEREVFALMVPLQVLESVGVEPQELQEIRQKRQNQFDSDLTKVTQSLIDLGDDTLKEMGATRDEISQFHEVKKSADNDNHKADNDNRLSSQMGRDGVSRLSHAVANLVVASSAKHDGKVQLATGIQK